MNRVIKNKLKAVAKLVPVAITKNQQYDRQTARVIRKACQKNSNAVDIGCHTGEIMDMFVRYSPEGMHYGFEPIPGLYEKLVQKYRDMPDCRISPYALSNKRSEAFFNLVLDDPALSGLKKRDYNSSYTSERIKVQTNRLDDVYPADLEAGFIKIDVEGAELQVLEGAVNTLKRCRPIVIFEHGLGASEFYDATPEKVFDLLESCGLNISTMKRWLSGKQAFSRDEFARQYYGKKNYYFIAFPG